MSTLQDQIKDKIRQQKGEKRDLNLLYGHQDLMEQILERIVSDYAGKVDYVASPESLGFILGSMAAAKLGVGFIPIRNKNLYGLEADEGRTAPYIDHRDLPRALQVRNGMIPSGSRILLVDDWVETAATIFACTSLVEDAGATVVGITSIGASRNAKTEDLLKSGKLSCLVITD